MRDKKNDTRIYRRLYLPRGGRVAYLKYLTAAVFSIFASGAHAGYAQLKPPPGWSQGLGAMTTPVTSVATVGTYNFGTAANAASIGFGAAANASSFSKGKIITQAALSIAGNTAKVPVSLKIGIDSAVAASTFSFGNPALFAGVFAASALYGYYKASGFVVKDNAWYKTDLDLPTCSNGVCTEYLYKDVWYKSIGTPLSNLTADLNAANPNIIWSVKSASPSGWVVFGRVDINNNPMWDNGYMIPTRTVPQVSSPPGSIPATLDDFIKNAKLHPLPDEVYPELPIPLPVEQPVLNPGPDGNPVPYFIPTGNPVPTPDPNVWNQPGVRLVPAPTPESPFRVDVQPENIPQDSPNPKTEKDLNPTTTPPPKGSPVSSDKLGLCDQYPGIAACAPAAKPEEKKKFCEENPDLLVCQKEETPDVPDLEKKNIEMSFRPDSGWGSGGGSCPADKVLSHATLSFRPYCDFMSGIRPAIIAVAWFIGALILIGKR